MSTAIDTVTLEKTKLKVPSMWAVVLHNDDFTPMDFVVELLEEVFNKVEEEAEGSCFRFTMVVVPVSVFSRETSRRPKSHRPLACLRHTGTPFSARLNQNRETAPLLPRSMRQLVD